MSKEYYIYLSVSLQDGNAEKVLKKLGERAVGTDDLKAVLSGQYNTIMRFIREKIEGFKPESLADIQENTTYYK